MREPNPMLTRSPISVNRNYIKDWFTYITGQIHFRNHLAIVGILREDTRFHLYGRAPESAKHLVKECGVGNKRRIFEVELPEKSKACMSREKIPELVKSIGV